MTTALNYPGGNVYRSGSQGTAVGVRRPTSGSVTTREGQRPVTPIRVTVKADRKDNK